MHSASTLRAKNEILHNGDGTFDVSAVTILGTPTGGSYVGPGYPGDFDGDGVLDRVVEFFGNGSLLRPGAYISAYFFGGWRGSWGDEKAA